MARSVIGILAVLVALSLFSLSSDAFHFRNFEVKPNDASIPTQWFTQRLDHFNAQDLRLWKQRYFVNDQYFKTGSNGPIFLQIGGEGPISTGYVTSLMMSQYAQTYGALQLALEHRFYGESAPLGNLSTANLRYLSSQQALADAALFVQTMRNKYNSTSPVIIFGGSYPGNLAAWFRMKYPNLVIGAIASSAPVQATLDFYQYLDVVDLSLSYFSGPQCDATIASATQIIEQLVRTRAGRSQLQSAFKLCGPMDNWDDVSTFIQALMGNFMETVQYNNEGSSPVNVDFICNIIKKYESDPLQAYAAVNEMFLKLQGQSCLDASYKDTIADLRTLDQGTGDGGRQWVYQTCAEFGYFQTTDSPSTVQPFGNLAPLNYSLQMCQDAFNVNFNTSLLIEQTNAIYGGKNLLDSATNILFINGNIDPWHALSVTNDIAPGIKAILINGTAHCADMSPPTSRDPPGLAEAQQQTSAYIGQLLNQYYSLLSAQ